MKCEYLLDRSSRLAVTWDDASLLTACPQVKRAAPTVLWGGLAGIGGSGPGSLLPARVGVEGGGAEGLEPGEQLAQPPVVVDPGLVVVVLLGAEPAAGGLGGDLAGDLPRAFRTAYLWLIHAADCRSRYSSWTCRGVRY